MRTLQIALIALLMTSASLANPAPAQAAKTRSVFIASAVNGTGFADFAGSIRWSRRQATVRGVLADHCPADDFGAQLVVLVGKKQQRFHFFYDGNGCDNGNSGVRVIVPRVGGRLTYITLSICEFRENGISDERRDCKHKTFRNPTL